MAAAIQPIEAEARAYVEQYRNADRSPGNYRTDLMEGLIEALNGALDQLDEEHRKLNDARAKVSELAVKLAEARRWPERAEMPAASLREVGINKHIESAARWLWHSMEAQSSMVRIHCCRQAALDLFSATALSDGKRRCILAAHFRQADALAGQFFGAGIGVSRLLDELRAALVSADKAPRSPPPGQPGVTQRGNL